MIAGQYIIEALTSYAVSLADIENILRRLKSRVFLIGFPLSFFSATSFISTSKTKNISLYNVCAKLPNQDKVFDYGLWIEMNGEHALQELINKHQLTDIDFSLEKTGFLFST